MEQMALSQQQPINRYYSLYGRLLSKPLLRDAFKKVKSNRGSAGIDRQSIGDFENNLESEINRLWQELKDKSYQPSPVKRVTLAKPDGGERQLGIPTVRDRVVQQALLALLEPIFDPDFHPSSYGYRKGRSSHDAINKASLFIRRYDRQWVVDMDLSKCFDTLDHDLIIESFRRKVTDGSILNLLRKTLESGVMTSGNYEQNEQGSPQGGVISPLIANVYLDHFDQYMMSRGHRIVRYADDILILCGSKKAAERSYKVATQFLEGVLKLSINTKKTRIVHSDEGADFLSCVIKTTHTRIQEIKVKHLKEKVRAITPRNAGQSMETLVAKLNPLLRGYANYFKIADGEWVFKSLMGWIRRRLRSIQLRKWKTPKRLKRRLNQLNKGNSYRWIEMKKWKNSASPPANASMPNTWFHDELGLVDMVSYLKAAC